MVGPWKGLKSRFSNSLALRYLTVTGAAVLGIQAVWGLIEGIRIYQRQVDVLEEKVAAQGEFLSEVAPEAIFNLDFLYLETLMRQTSEDADIIYSIILDRKGLPLTQYLNHEDPLIAKALASLAGDTQPLSILRQAAQEGPVERIIVPVDSFGQTLGEVHIGYSKRRVYGEVSQAALSSLLTTLTVGFVLAVTTYLLFEREVRRPLGKLAFLAKDLEKGKLQERVILPRKDEIGVLGRALNRMARQLQKTLEGAAQARDKAIAASHAKSEFLSNMSHELRTPLNAILGFTQLLERDDSIGKKQKENIRVVNRSGAHLLSLINNILEMSKIEAGRVSIEANAFDLKELLKSIQQMFLERAKSKAIHITFDYPLDLPAYVEADEGKLRQVLINLIGNSIKFTEQGGVSVYVEVLEERAETERETAISPSDEEPHSNIKHHQLRFSVEDTGPGIPPEDLGTIFETFTQTQTGKDSQQGTGLGLPLSRKFVQLMGGNLTVQSAVGEGTVFSFTISVMETTADRVKTSNQQHSRVIKLVPGQPRYRLLVAEDVLENRRLLVGLLEAVGFEVKEAQDGMEALKLWQSWSPHLIWMDMRMPVMDGYEATNQIREAENLGKTNHGRQKPVTVILALTAFAFEEHRQQAIEAGCDDYVRKPFQEHEVFDKLNQYLGVEYIYEGDDAVARPEEGPQSPTALAAGEVLPMEVVIEKLAALSMTQREALQAAAIRLDKQAALDVITDIAETEPSLAHTLKGWIGSFRFDKILDCLNRGAVV